MFPIVTPKTARTRTTQTSNSNTFVHDRNARCLCLTYSAALALCRIWSVKMPFCAPCSTTPTEH